MRSLLFLLPFALCYVGCDGEDGGGGESSPMLSLSDASSNAPADTPPIPDDGGVFLEASIAPPPDGGNGMDVDSGTLMPPGSTMMGECRAGETRCPEEGGAALEFCRSDQVWALRGCGAGEVCLAGGCIPDPSNCADGSRICLPTGTPALCNSGTWQSLDECQNGNTCFEGTCLTRACASAAQRSSYQGCDYLAVDLPNSTLSTEDPANSLTPDAPMGLVVANTTDQPVKVDVLGPEGAATPLVADRMVNVPDNVPFEVRQRFQAQRVSSQIRDANGMVVRDAIAMGSDIEVPPLGTAILLLPRKMGPLSASAIQRDAYRLKSNLPVVVYQFSPYCCKFSFSNDASLLLPVTALGTRYRYLGTPYFSFFAPPRSSNTPATMAIVSPYENNDVTIDLPRGTSVAFDTAQRVVPGILCQGDQDCPAGTGRSQPAPGLCSGQDSLRNINLTLGAQEVLTLLVTSRAGPESDMSSSVITSSKPVSVFSSHICTYYPEASGACDHLQEQILPVSTWGTSFQLVPPAERNPGFPTDNVWKFIGDEEVTRIRLSVPLRQLNPLRPGFAAVPYCQNYLAGDDTIVLRRGEYCEFGTRTTVAAVADKPTMVMGIIVGQEAAGILTNFGDHGGDPALFLVPPDRQYRRDYVFMTPDTYFSDYVTVITPPGNQIELDGQPVDLAGASAVAGQGSYSFLHIPLANDGAHTIRGELPFGIIVYAYDDFVSYAFTGGLNLSKR